MAETGWKFPTTNGFDVGGNPQNDWTNPTNAYADDGSYTTFVDGLTRGAQTYGDFGFGIPVGNIINGIVIETEGKISAGTGFIEFGYNYSRASSPSNYAPVSWWSTSDSIDTKGSSTDPLSAASGADMADGNFYFRLRTPAANTGSTYSLDYVRVNVYHSAPSSFMPWFNDID